MLKKLIVFSVIVFFTQTIFAQDNSENNFDKKQILKEKILRVEHKDSLKGETTSYKKKNPAISIFLSLLVPGAGHLYAGRMDVGKYFLATEAACWLGVVGLDLYGNWLRDDSRTFASEHSGLNKNGKDDDYFSNVGSYDNIYLYNNEKLANGQWEKIYDINSYFWNWDNETNKNLFDTQRKRSERTYNARIVFVTGLVVNRIISAMSALILTNKINNNSSSGIRISSEFIGTQQNPYDGIKLNFIKSF
jgi:hypothetical protein